MSSGRGIAFSSLFSAAAAASALPSALAAATGSTPDPLTLRPSDVGACLLSFIPGSGHDGAGACAALPARLNLTTYEAASIVFPVAAYWIYCSFLHFVAPHLTFLESYRIPTDQPRRPRNRITVGHVVRAVILQHAIQMTLATALAMYLHDPVEGSRIEALSVMAVKIFCGMFILDTWEYWLHRWMHTNPLLYRTFHSVHHRLTENFSFGALYNHPIEGLILDSVGGAISSLLTGMTPHTATIFYTLATLKTVDDHCGYCWPWIRVLFANNAKYHDVHHWGKGIKFNYAQPFFTFWDEVGGTKWILPEEELPTDDAPLRDAASGKRNANGSAKSTATPRRRSPRLSETEGVDSVAQSG